MTRAVSDWFHEREGELFTENQIPFTRKEIVQVINDSIDPIQQVLVNGEKYIGVISFEEHNGWYEYTRWDDKAGEVSVGVCAKCVKKSEYTNEVSRTIDESTSISEEKFVKHYSDEHTVKPDEIETGATLLSGTTINSNEVIHPGMDGSGSTVDAERIKGNTVSSLLRLGQSNKFNRSTPVISQFPSIAFRPTGIGVDANDSIWHADAGAGSIYQLDQNVTVLSEFASPCSDAQGVGVGSDGSIWHADTDAESIYQLDQNGNILSKFASPSFDPTGIGLDSNDSIWNTDPRQDSVYQLNQVGGIISQFDAPFASPQGAGFDSSDCIWISDASADSIFQFNQNGTVLSGIESPCAVPKGVGLDSNDSIWHCDPNPDSIYQMAQSQLIEFQ